MAAPFDRIEPRINPISPENTGRDVLFLHGAWHGAWCWQGLQEPVAQAGYRVFCLELPGHGQDRWRLPAMTSLKDYGDVARRAAAQLNSPVLIGHSMGGWIAQKVLESVDLPAVLIAPLPGNGLPLGRLMRIMGHYPGKMMGASFGRPLVVGTHDMHQRLFYLPGTAPDQLPELDKLVPEPARVVMEMGMGLARAKPGPGKQPRLVIAGGLDYFFGPQHMRALAARLGADCTVFDELPHNLWIQDPEGKTAGRVLQFLAAL